LFFILERLPTNSTKMTTQPTKPNHYAKIDKEPLTLLMD
jgi:hypothetical protein